MVRVFLRSVQMEEGVWLREGALRLGCVVVSNSKRREVMNLGKKRLISHPQNSIYKLWINFIVMESGTILHLALLRKISNLSTNPNYREKLHHLRRPKPQSENETSAPSFPNFKKQSQFPLLEIANRQDNCTALASKKKQRRSFFQQNTTISAWSVNGAEEPAVEQQLRYNHPHQNKIAKVEKDSRKNYSFASPNEGSVCKQNQHPSNGLGRRRQQLASRHKYSLVKHVNLQLQQERSAEKKQGGQEGAPCISQKLSSFQAFVAQARLRAKAGRRQ